MCKGPTDEVYEWEQAAPDYVPDQAVIFHKRFQAGAMYISRVKRHDETLVGVFQINRPCAEYSWGHQAKCGTVFDFLVLKHRSGKQSSFLMPW